MTIIKNIISIGLLVLISLSADAAMIQGSVQNSVHDIFLPPFHDIQITTSQNVVIYSGQSISQLTVIGPQPMLTAVSAKVIGQTLYVSSKPLVILHHKTSIHEQPLTIEIYVPSLAYLETSTGNVSVELNNGRQPLSIKKVGPGILLVKGRRVNLQQLENIGNGPITIRQIDSKNVSLISEGTDADIYLYGKVGLRQFDVSGANNITIRKLQSFATQELYIYNDGNVTLQGVFKLSKIEYGGSGLMKIYWVDSQQLEADVYGSATLSLAGVTNVLNATVHHGARLDARYLRSDNVFVKTYDHAAADVWPRLNLFALAEDYSDIYYYHQPNYIWQMMRQSGSILSMENIPDSLLGFEPSFYARSG